MSTPPDFESLYREDPDPWQVATLWYEQRKLDIVLASLRRPRYQIAWDPACGTGHLAERLAARAGTVCATDTAPTATRLTIQRCAHLDNVTVRQLTLPDSPAGIGSRPDLIVLSEFFYYLDDVQRQQTLHMIDGYAAPVCDLVSVHWRHAPDDAWLSGAGAQAEITARLTQAGWSHSLHHREADFILDRLDRTGAC
jgi:hypothetical protein